MELSQRYAYLRSRLMTCTDITRCFFLVKLSDLIFMHFCTLVYSVTSGAFSTSSWPKCSACLLPFTPLQ